MLLVCPRCQNQFTMDDQAYAQQGALCPNCMEPLVPAQDNGYQNDQWGNQGGYSEGGYGNDGQWNGQQQGYEGYGNDGQWNGQQQGYEGYGNDGQWNGQQQGYGNDGQWNGQQQNAQQWQDQGGYQSMPTQGVNQEDLQQSAPQYEGNERTMALDISDAEFPPTPDKIDSFLSSSSSASAPQSFVAPEMKEQTSDDDWGDAWHSTKPADSPAPKGKPYESQVIGAPMVNHGNEQKTRQIDVTDVQKMYGDKVNPFKTFFGSIPMMYKIIAGAVLAVALIGFCIAAYQISKPEKTQLKIASNGELVEENTPDAPLTYKEIVYKTKEVVKDAMSLSKYEDLQNGIVVGISEDAGIIINNEKVASLESVKSGRAFNKDIYKAAKKFASEASPDDAFILLFDGGLDMTVVYHVMYSIAPAGHAMFMAGSSPTGISGIELRPGEWASQEIDGKTYEYSTESPNTELKLTRGNMTLRRVGTEESLYYDDENGDVSELSDEFLGGKVTYDNISHALNKFKMAKQPSIKITPDSGVTVRLFIDVLSIVYGAENRPNVQRVILSAESLD